MSIKVYMITPFVFRRDAKRCQELKARLEDCKYEVYVHEVAPETIDKPMLFEDLEHLKECDIAVVCLTSEAPTKNVWFEMGLAVALNKQMVGYFLNGQFLNSYAGSLLYKYGCRDVYNTPESLGLGITDICTQTRSTEKLVEEKRASDDITLAAYEEWIKGSWNYPHKHSSDEEAQLHFTLGLAGETGEVVEYIKKKFFCKSSDATSKLEPLENELGDVLWYLTALCYKSGTSLAQIARINRSKLIKKYGGKV